MENLANLYIIIYYQDLINKDDLKILKVTTNQQDAEEYLLAKVKDKNLFKSKDKHWQVLVYKYIPSSRTYELSKEETFNFKNIVGLCNQCQLYFKRVNNSNMCADCNTKISKGYKKCDICLSFFDPTWNEINVKSNSVLMPFVCNECSMKLYEKV